MQNEVSLVGLDRTTNSIVSILNKKAQELKELPPQRMTPDWMIELSNDGSWQIQTYFLGICLLTFDFEKPDGIFSVKQTYLWGQQIFHLYQAQIKNGVVEHEDMPSETTNLSSLRVYLNALFNMLVQAYGYDSLQSA